MAGPIRAEDLAKLLGNEIMDIDSAAAFLGLSKNGVDYAAYREHLPYVQYGMKKYFTRADLLDYHAKRGKGRESQLEKVEHFEVPRRTPVSV